MGVKQVQSDIRGNFFPQDSEAAEQFTQRICAVSFHPSGFSRPSCIALSNLSDLIAGPALSKQLVY